jgi:MoxR-like ATPase
MYKKIDNFYQELSKVVIGQKDMVEALFLGLICDGHILLEGVPGLAKTTTVNAIAKTLDLNFKRVQFTPDLLPTDILGAQIYDPQKNEFRMKKGPIFTNLLLADEINRAPSKVQSALLEVMQEKQVTIAETTFGLDLPFLVMATQNPVESEGAYTLPEAQLDRFMMKVVIGYNTKEEELLISQKVANNSFETINKSLNIEDLKQIKEKVKDIHIDKQLHEYIINLIFATRNPKEHGLEDIAQYIQFGASPRATIDLLKVAKAKAFLNKKEFVTPSDIASVFRPILRHRIVLSYEALADDITTDDILHKVLETVDIP